MSWPPGATPHAAPGLLVNAFASGLNHPRWLLALPSCDVLVAETIGPDRPDDAVGLRGLLMGRAMRTAGAASPSANRITLLRDADADGFAELRCTLLAGLNSPFGMAVIANELFVGVTDAVLVFPYHPGATHIGGLGRRLLSLPPGRIDHH